MTECDEIANSILDTIDGASFAAIADMETARQLAKRYLADDETNTVIDNVAESLYRSAQTGREST
jgi:type IV secretory pathway TraG/TraD family ATPase VirD4